jgi:site-specific recombinase XerD
MVWNRRKRSRPERGVKGRVNPPSEWVWSTQSTHETLTTRVVTALRALLRFLHVRGYLASGLADAVPAIAKWHRQSLPVTPQDGEIAQLLAGCDRDTDVGRRDYTILVLLTRLGLRISEVAALRLDAAEPVSST